MKMTSAEAAKLLRTLNEEIDSIRGKENRSATFVAAIEEDIESVRPAYDYAETQEKINALEKKVRIVKHAISCFNVTTEVPGFGMTVDQMLVYIPQLNMKKSRLSMMAERLPKERSSSGYGAKAIVEYTYANYEIGDAENDLKAVTEELAKAQTALDVVNNSVVMEIELD